MISKKFAHITLTNKKGLKFNNYFLKIMFLTKILKIENLREEEIESTVMLMGIFLLNILSINFGF